MAPFVLAAKFYSLGLGMEDWLIIKSVSVEKFRCLRHFELRS